MKEIIEFVTVNSALLLGAASGIYLAAGFIAKMTQNTSDDKWIKRIGDFCARIGIDLRKK